MKNYGKETFKIYYQHLLTYKWVVLLVVISVVIGSLGAVLTPIFYKDFFDVLTGDGQVIEQVAILRHILFKILAVHLITWVFWRIATYGSAYFQSRVMEDLYNSCFSYLHQHSVAFFNNNFVGTLVKRVNRFISAFEDISDIFLWNLLGIFISVVLFVVVLFDRNIYLGLGILSWAIIYIFINYAFAMYKMKYDLQRAEANSKLTGVLADTITNQLNVKVFSAYKRELKLFAKVNSELRYWLRYTWNLGVVFESLQAILMIALEVGIFFLPLILNIPWLVNCLA